MSFNRFASLTCLLSLYFLVSSVSTQPVCNDCCNRTVYTELNEPRRSIRSVWRRGQTPLCDRRLRRGWYRFTSFNGTAKMPEQKANDSHCGTHDPVWLSDRHPTKEKQNVALKACITSFGNPCSDYLYINVVNCGGYYVYYLKPLYYCAAAYCAGFGEPCPYGKVGEEPDCYEPFQKFSSDNLGDPVINYTQLKATEGEDDGVAVSLTCQVPLLNGIGALNNVAYKIEWYAEGKTLLIYERCGNLPCGKRNSNPCPNATSIQSKLPGSNYSIGQSLSCNVSAKFTDVNCEETDPWSTPKHVREPFFAGLKVIN